MAGMFDFGPSIGDVRTMLGKEKQDWALQQTQMFDPAVRAAVAPAMDMFAMMRGGLASLGGPDPRLAEAQRNQAITQEIGEATKGLTYDQKLLKIQEILGKHGKTKEALAIGEKLSELQFKGRAEERADTQLGLSISANEREWRRFGIEEERWKVTAPEIKARVRLTTAQAEEAEKNLQELEKRLAAMPANYYSEKIKLELDEARANVDYRRGSAEAARAQARQSNSLAAKNEAEQKGMEFYLLSQGYVALDLPAYDSEGQPLGGGFLSKAPTAGKVFVLYDKETKEELDRVEIWADPKARDRALGIPQTQGPQEESTAARLAARIRAKNDEQELNRQYKRWTEAAKGGNSYTMAEIEQTIAQMTRNTGLPPTPQDHIDVLYQLHERARMAGDATTQRLIQRRIAEATRARVQ